MTTVWVSQDQLVAEGRKRMEDTEVVLDIGCGIQPQRYVSPAVHICCEPFDQYIEVLQTKIRSEYDRQYVILKGSWEDALRVVPPKSVDTVFILDVIEHLDKTDGLRLLHATEKLARRQVVIFTPLGFMPQCHADGKDAWNLDGGTWQEHKSGWTPEDFGDGWDFVACKDFHQTDHAGVAFPEPYGAFFAIRTVTEADKPTEAETRRKLIHGVRKELEEIRNMNVITDIGRLVHAVRRMKDTPVRAIYKRVVERFR